MGSLEVGTECNSAPTSFFFSVPRQPHSSFLFRANLFLLFCSAPTSFFFSVPRQPLSSFLFRANLILLFCSAPTSFFFSVPRHSHFSFLFRANLQIKFIQFVSKRSCSWRGIKCMQFVSITVGADLKSVPTVNNAPLLILPYRHNSLLN